MKKLVALIGTLIIFAALVWSIGTQKVIAQSSSLWFVTGGRLKPIVSSWEVNGPNGFSGSHAFFSGLGDCSNTTTSKLLYTLSTGKFSCGTDQTGGGGSSPEVGTQPFSGAVLRLGDDRYVNTSGDTMTGKLTINLSSGTDALEVIQTASASILHAQSELHSSGSLIIEGQATLHGNLEMDGGNITNLGDVTFKTGAQGGTLRTGTSGADKFLLQGYDVNDGVYRNVFEVDAGNSVTFEFNNENADVDFHAEGVSDGSLFYLDASTDRVGVGTAIPGYKFDVSGTAHATTLLSSGSLVWEGAASGASLYVATSLQGAGLTDCDDPTSTLNWDSATGRFSCGTDDTGVSGSPEVGTASFSGGVLVLGDDRYVRTSGDTMTGALVIDVTGGSSTTIGLNVLNTISGAIIHAKSRLRSSGTLLVEGTANIDDGSFVVNSSTNRVGIGTASPNDTLTIISQGDTFGVSVRTSGSEEIGRMYQARTNAGGITLYHENTATVEFAADDFPSYINGGGNFGVGLRDPSTTIEALGTISGTILTIESTLASSGSLVWEGAGSGSSLYVASSLNGVGLTDCDVSATSKLLWDATTGRFSCGTDQSGGSSSFGTGNVLTIGDDRYVNTSGDTMTGNLVIDVGLNGAVVDASLKGIQVLTATRGNLGVLVTDTDDSRAVSLGTDLSGNGQIGMWNAAGVLQTLITGATDSFIGTVNDTSFLGIGTASPAAKLHILQTQTEPAFLVYDGNSDSTPFFIGQDGNVGIGTASPKGKLHVIGSGSFAGSISGTTLNANTLLTGATIQGFGLYNCNGSSNKLTYNATTKKFLCETDQAGSSGLVDHYVNAGGDTMTGSLNIRATMSGYIVNTNKINLARGTAASPGFVWRDDTDTGIFGAALDIVGVSSDGVQVAWFTGTGITLFNASGGGPIGIRTAAGSPENSIAAPNGSLYVDATNAKLYQKTTSGSAVGNDGWLPTVQTRFIRKSSDEATISDAVLSNDAELFTQVGANETIVIDMTLIIDSGATPDLQFAFTAPSGSTCVYGGNNDTGSNLPDATETCGGSIRMQTPGVGDLKVVKVTGTIVTGGTAGLIRLQWAQGTSAAANTTVHAGSYAMFYRNLP